MFDPREVPPDQPYFILAREIAAPVERVFAAFGDVETIGSWWGPTGFRTSTSRMDFRVGGDWVHTMHGPDGTDYPNCSIYLEIVPNERIVYDHTTAPGEPILFRAEIRLTTTAPGRTRIDLTLRCKDVETRDMLALKFGALEGGREHLMRLDAFLTASRTVTQSLDGTTIRLSRRVDAPRAVVFAAWTDARLMLRWWGPHGFQIAECVSEPRVGGRYRIEIRSPDGTAYPLEGRFTAIEADRRLVIASDLSEHPKPWHEMMAAAIRSAGGPEGAVVGPVEMTIDLADAGGGTRIDVGLRSPTEAEAKAFIGVGAVAGWVMTFERLDALLLDIARQQPG